MDNSVNNSLISYQPGYFPQDPGNPLDEEISKIGQKRLTSPDRPEIDLEKRARIGVVKLKLNPSQQLWQAAYNKNWDLVRTLLKRGDVDVNTAPKHGKNKGQSVLFITAWWGQWNLVREMLKCENPNVNSGPLKGINKGMTVLWFAVNKQQWDIVREMLQFGNANVNACTPDGKTVLWGAACYKRWDIVREMLKYANADVNAAPSNGKSKGITVLLHCANKYQWDLVREMLKCANVNVNAAAPDGLNKGLTVLWLAAKYNQWDLVREMLKYANANVNVAPLDGPMKGVNFVQLLAKKQQWDLVREAMKLPVSEETLQSVIPLFIGGRQTELTYYWIIRCFNQVTPKATSMPQSEDRAFLISLKDNTMNVVLKVVEFFFNQTDLPRDLKFMFAKKAILTELNIFSLGSYHGMNDALNHWIHFAENEYPKDKVKKENDVIKKLSFRQWRWKQDMVRLDVNEFSKPRITDIHNMIEDCLNEFRKAYPQKSFANAEIRQRVIEAISNVKVLNQTSVLNAIIKAFEVIV